MEGLFIIPLLVTLISQSSADYDCLCNYNIDIKIHASPDVLSAIIGRMYEFDCKPSLATVKNTSDFVAIQFEKKIGYLQPNEQVQKQICSGDPSPDDLVTTTAATIVTSKMTSMRSSSFVPITTKKVPISTTRKTTVMKTTTKIPLRTTTKPPLITTTRAPIITSTKASIQTTKAPLVTTTRAPVKTTTTPRKTSIKTTSTFTVESTTKSTPRPMTTTMSPVTSSVMKTTVMTTDKPGIVKDHIEVCPDHVKTDVQQKGGFLGQYGDFCIELVDWTRPFDAAESHCRITSGHLVAITNQDEQDYVTGLLTKRNYTKSAWIGLNDKNGEGAYQWTSGTPYSYNNLKGDFNQHTAKDHTLNDCFVIKDGGEWTDLPCGVSLTFLGLGEQHPFICQYNVSAKVQSLFEIIPQVIG